MEGGEGREERRSGLNTGKEGEGNWDRRQGLKTPLVSVTFFT